MRVTLERTWRGFSTTLVAVVALLGWAGHAGAQLQSQVIAGPTTELPDEFRGSIDSLLKDAKPDAGRLGAVVDGLASNRVAPGGYALLHLVQWKDRQIKRQRWLVYRKHAGWSAGDMTGTRLFGVRQFQFLEIHQGAPAGVQYTVDVSKKESDPVQSLRALVQVAGAVGVLGAGKWTYDVAQVDVQSAPSDVTLHLAIPAKAAADGDATVEVANQAFDNEGLSWWNVSIGIPTTRVSELEYNAKDGTVRTKEIDKQGLLGLVNIGLQPMDTKNARRQLLPSLILGMGITKKPLDRLVIGLASGFSLAQVYAGVQYTRVEEPASLKTGSTATEAQLAENLRSKYKPAFTVGLSVPTRQLLERLTAKE